MLKCADEAAPFSVPEEAILGAATRFLQRCYAENDLIPAANIESPDLGGTDLAFIKRDRSGLIVVRLHRRENFADFFLNSAAFKSWFEECLHLTETILQQPIGLEVYLISHDVPPTGSPLWKAISKISGLCFVKYSILNIEVQQMPVVRFETLEAYPHAKKRVDAKQDRHWPTAMETCHDKSTAVSGLSSDEIDEFYRLKALHL